MRITVMCIAVICCASLFADSSLHNVDVEVQKSSAESGLLRSAVIYLLAWIASQARNDLFLLIDMIL